MNWWHYLLLVNFYLVLFFGFYALLLRRETFFQLNRIYLVAASLLSFLIPIIQADWVKNLFITQQVQYSIYSSPVMVYNFAPAKDVLTIGELLNTSYIVVTLFLALRLIWQLVILKKAIEKPEPSAAYSFFKKISLGDNLANDDVIAAHEQVHAQQWHSIDVMIIETVMIINWFNPIVYLYRFAIKYIHEFIADRQVLQAGTDKADYAMLLLSQTFNAPAHSLTNPFYNHSLLKQRIMMLQKNKSQRIMLAKYGLSAPLFILMLIFSSATVNNSKAVNTINNKAQNVFLTPAEDAVTGIIDHAEIPDGFKAINKNENTLVLDTTHTKGKIFTSVEKQPYFRGGVNAFYMFLGKVARYPKVDRENNIQGRVIVQFIIEKNGSLSAIKALRGPSETLKNEAVRALSISPKWIPGHQNGKAVRVQYTVPVNFTLGDDSTTDTKSSDSKVFSAVEVQPDFPGGMNALYRFLAKNIRYPADMRKNNVQGRVIIRFVVEKDGSLSDIRVLRSPGYGSAEESIRVMSISPKWSPGIQNGNVVRVQYTVPINFTLGKTEKYGYNIKDNDSTDNKTVQVIGYATNPVEVLRAKINNDHPIFISGKDSPLFIYDGKEISSSLLKTLDPNSIQSISVLKDVSATALYGTKGVKGVIIVTGKKRPSDVKVIEPVN